MLTALIAMNTLAACGTAAPALTVDTDPRSHAVVIRTAAIDLPAADEHAGHYGYHQHGPLTPITPFTWPVEGWARGFKLRLLDCQGNEVSRNRLHHAVVLHLEHRELMYPIYERLLAFTQESEDLTLPRGIGLRIEKGAELGLLAAWMPVEAQAERVVLEITIPWMAANTMPRPVDVLPLGFDVHYEAGGSASFDVPAGRSTFSRSFEIPIDGRLLVAGGHLHDYAASMVLTDEATGKVMVDIKPRRAGDGRVTGVERKLFGVSGDGIALKAGRRYHLAVTYDNPTGELLPQSGMGIMVGLFSPKEGRQWPALDRREADFLKDVEMFARSGFLPKGAVSATAARKE